MVQDAKIPNLRIPEAPRRSHRGGGWLSARSWSGVATALLTSLLLTSLAPTALAADPSPVLDPGRALARAEVERKPILLLAAPETGREALLDWRSGWSKSTAKRLSKEFLVIEVIIAEGKWPVAEPSGEGETPQPWDLPRARAFLEQRLGQLGTGSVVALLDFSGEVIDRSDGSLPKSSSFKKALRKALSENEVQKKAFAKVEKGNEVIGLALKKKKYRDACRAYLQVRSIKIPLDSKPASDRQERYRSIQSAFEDRNREAKKFEDDNDLGTALAEYERILAEFPIPEWQEELRAKIGRLYREIYGNPGGGVGGGTGTGGGR